MTDTVVVYVHGLWFTGHEALLLRARLARGLGARDRAFAYRSVHDGLDANAASLGAYLATLRCERLHLVGHSLGGALIVRMFASGPTLPPGRVLLLGSPLRGSEAARALGALPGGGALLGRTMRELLAPGALAWNGQRDLGIIAGDAGFGLGRLVSRLAAPNDGTILVDETRLDGANAHRVLPVTHFGMLLSREVARQGVAFLRDGRFV